MNAEFAAMLKAAAPTITAVAPQDRRGQIFYVKRDPANEDGEREQRVVGPRPFGAKEAQSLFGPGAPETNMFESVAEANRWAVVVLLDQVSADTQHQGIFRVQ